MKSAVVFVICIYAGLGLQAQSWAKYVEAPNKKLKVGDKIPFTEIHHMINYPKKTLTLTDQKAKLIILDFWGTTCKSCVAGWPRTLEIQKEFGDDLLIILVNRFEREAFIRDFLKRRKKLTGVEMKLPISLRDSTLWEYFPERSVPRYAWITPDGIIGSITSVDQFTAANIKTWITSGPFGMRQMNDELPVNVDPVKPIFVEGNGGEPERDSFIWSASLTKAQPNINTFASFLSSPKEGYAISVTGFDIYSLYALAYDNRREVDDIIPFFFLGLPSSRMEFISKDSAAYFIDRKTSENRYNYQLIPGKQLSLEQLKSLMRQDLNRYFGLDATWEKRRKMCIVWSMFDSTRAISLKTSISKDIYIGDDEISLDSVRVRDAIRFMEIGTSKYFRTPYPIVDETNYKGLLIGIRYEGNGYDLKQWDKDMSRYGIHIRLEPREVDVLVLREPSQTN